MLRLAVYALTLTALPLFGESFVSTNGSSSMTTIELNLRKSHTSIFYNTRSMQRIRGSTKTGRQRQRQQESQSPFSSPIVSSLVSYRRSSSILNSALLTDSSSSGHVNRKGRGQKPLHRRILGMLSWRKRSESSSSLPSSSIEQEEAQTGMVESFVMYNEANEVGEDDFVARNFNLTFPEDVLPVVQVDLKDLNVPKVDPKLLRRSKPPVIDTEYFDVSITPSDTGTTKGASTTPDPVVKRKTPTNWLVSRLMENFLTERIGRWTTETPEGLKVDIRSSADKYNHIGRLLFKGLYRADACLSSDRIVFPMIRFSSVSLQMELVTLNLMGFFLSNNNGNKNDNGNCDNNDNHDQQQRKNNRQRNQNQPGRSGNTASDSSSTKATGKGRYPKQFDLHIEDLTMSRHDLLRSSCIKNGLRQLLINVLKDRGVRSDSIRITSIDILRNGKISCIGEAKMHFPSIMPVHFEVRSGISHGNQGHVLTFPGLEVSLNRDIGLFVPVHPTLDLDVGHNTKFQNIVIDGRQKLLKVAASVTITPERTRLTQDYVQRSDAFSSIFFYDVGQWLTQIGRFSK